MRNSCKERALVLILVSAGLASAAVAEGAGAVQLSEDDTTFSMSNGTLSVNVSKTSGDLISMEYQGKETLTDRSGHPFVYWSHDVKGGESIETRVTIDPSENGGERAEVSVKGISGGTPMGHGPGAPPEGDIAVDIDIRYSLARGDQGVYAYTIFEHKPEYPAGDFTEARLAAKLEPGFRNVHIDPYRNGPYPLIAEHADKYIYTTLQFDHRAYGATNPDHGLGWWMIVPSPEFLSCGPTQPDFLVHGDLVVFCYWRSSHYGQSNITVAEGEHWTKVVGPVLMYANRGENSEAMWDDAKARLAAEEAAWPYAWVNGGGFAHRDERAEVTGRIVLHDPLDPSGGTLQGRLTVGLTQTPYTVQTPNGAREIDWQHDAKFYQHWAHSHSRDGRFTLPKVPAGTYNLHAFADGVLGELFTADIKVPAGGNHDVGEIQWIPVRHGKQLWELGKADRDAMEFAGADTFWHPDTALQFPKRFPQETSFRIGQSDPAKDWFYAHMPYLDDPNARIRPFFGVSGETKDASRTIAFDLDEAMQGTATLRVALTGTGGNPALQLQVNDQPVGTIRFGANDGALTRHQIRGDWREQSATFDASLLKAGPNSLTLTVPQGSPNDGVVYDYLRLEVDEDA